jgi:hypothetical protein
MLPNRPRPRRSAPARRRLLSTYGGKCKVASKNAGFWPGFLSYKVHLFFRPSKMIEISAEFTLPDSEPSHVP